MIQIVPAYFAVLLCSKKFRSLITALCLVVLLILTASFIVPSYFASTTGLRPGEASAANSSNDLSVTEVTAAMGTLGRLWSNQNPITVTIQNSGTLDQNNIVVELFITGANTAHLTQTVPSLAAGASTTLSFTATITTTGTQTIEAKVAGDDDNSNNTKLITQEITCNAIAYTGAEPIYDGVGFGAGTGILAARYQAPGINVQLTGVTLHLSNNPSNIGKSITGVLLDEFGNIIADGAPFYATASDLNTTVQLTFYSPAIVNAGDVFYAGIRQDEGNQAPVGIALPATAPPNRYFTFPADGGTATPYTDPGSLTIGVLTDVSAELNSSVFGQIQAGQRVTFTATPGFAEYTFKINDSIAQASADNVFTYFPSNNDIVSVEIGRNGCHSAPLGNYVMDVREIVPSNGILYVNKNNPVPGDGSSWANALTELADALRWAKAKQDDWTPSNPLQIWVAGGTYKPLYSPADNNFGNADGMNNAFLLVSNVKVYGGFAGTETLLSDRDLSLTAHKSILSGDYNDDDVITGTGRNFDLSISQSIENACHVVIASGSADGAVLDGFTVTGGGGSSEIQEDIEVNGNTITKLGGGGLHNYMAAPVYANLIVSGNRNPFYGAGIYNDQSSAIFTNVLLINNLSEFLGGGMLNANMSFPVFTNVTISNNYAAVDGGGIANINSFPAFRNAIVHGNSSSYSNDNSFPAFEYSLIEGMPEDQNNHILNGSLDPQFTDPAAGDYTVKLGSPVVNAGNSVYYEIGLFPDLTDINTDLQGKARIVGTTIDMGAFESSSKDQVITAADISLTYGDPDHTLTATASSGLPVSYSIPANEVAELYQDATDNNKWKVKIKKAGAVTIMASQPGDGTYDPAPDVPIVFFVNRKELIATADDKTKEYGASLPQLTISYTGFVGNDNAQMINAPSILTSATAMSAPGTYPILLKDGDAENYELKLVNGTLTVTGTVITIQQQPTDQVVCAGSTATFTIQATGAYSTPVTYQWQQSTDSSTWNDINGANTDQFSTTAVNNFFYRCVLTAPGRVVNTNAVKLSVKAMDKPVINLPSTICLSQARFTLSASLPGGVFSGTGVSGTTWNLDTLRPGLYTIQYTYGNNNGCTTTVSKSVNLSLCSEKGLVTATRAQPNPTTGLVTVKVLVTESGRRTITVSNSFGQQVVQQQVQLRKGWNQFTYNLSGYSAGIYFITVAGYDKKPATVISVLKK